MFTGDLVALGTSVMIHASRGGNLADYMRSLERVLEHEPRVLLPAHGARVDDPRALITGYLNHRRERERQVIAALRAGHATVEAIAESIYHDLVAGAAAGRARERARAPREASRRRAGGVRRRPVENVGDCKDMDKVIDFINVNREKASRGAEGAARDSEHQRAAAARRRRQAVRRVVRRRDGGASACRTSGLIETPGNPVVYGDWLGAAEGSPGVGAPAVNKRADDSLLRPLRRAARRSPRAVGIAAVRGDDS